MSNTVTLGGNPFAVAGELPRLGDTAPPFTLVAKDLSDATLATFSGLRKVLNVFPSVDTPVCATSVRTFNEAAASLDDTVVLCISADLPFAQNRFCGAEGLDNVRTLSTVRNAGFLADYGVAIAAGPFAGLAARAVFVLDADDTVIHVQLVPEIASEPDYEAALAVLK